MSASEMQKLPELLKAVHDLTGVKVAVYNLDYDEIMAYPASSVEFCAMIRRQENGLNACNSSERARCELCRQQKKQQIVQCHAGLTEIVVPIMQENNVIGYIMLGQFVRTDERETFLRQVCAKCHDYGVERQRVLALAEQVPCCSETQMQSVAKIVDVIASYIVYSGLLYPTQTPLRQMILDHIAKNLSSDLSIQALCCKFCVSKSELYRILSTHAPDGVAAYVRGKRFEKACELLRYTRKPVWQIAEEVGYDNPDYFLRAFKKELGLSAGKYRKGLEMS